MATYRDTLVQTLLDWPSSYLNEDDILDQLFFSIGTGYEWEGGQLVGYEYWKLPTDPRLEAERANPWVTRAKSREYRETMSGFKVYGQCFFKRASGHIGRYMYSCFGSLSPICNLPDDIQPDWLAAAKRALKYAKSNRMRTTSAQKAWLVSAAARIRELELSRKTSKSSRKAA